MSPSNFGRTPVMNETKKYRTWSISQASKRDKKRGITGFLCNQWLRIGEIVAEKSAGCLDLVFLGGGIRVCRQPAHGKMVGKMQMFSQNAHNIQNLFYFKTASYIYF